MLLLVNMFILKVYNYNLGFMPPDIIIVSPLMYDASSDTRNETAPAHSSGLPNLVGKITRLICIFMLYLSF